MSEKGWYIQANIEKRGFVARYRRARLRRTNTMAITVIGGCTLGLVIFQTTCQHRISKYDRGLEQSSQDTLQPEDTMPKIEPWFEQQNTDLKQALRKSNRGAGGGLEIPLGTATIETTFAGDILWRLRSKYGDTFVVIGRANAQR
jgi:hypothetical protein